MNIITNEVVWRIFDKLDVCMDEVKSLLWTAYVDATEYQDIPSIFIY